MLEVGADDGGEEPGADDLVRLRAERHREDAGEEVVVLAPAAGDLRGQRRGGPGVHDVGVGDEAAGPAPLLLAVAGGDVDRRIDRQPLLGRHQRRAVVRRAVVAQRVPEREGDAEEALAADAPVARQPLDPGVVARPHVGRVPAQLGAAGQPLGAVVQGADEPLPAGEDLQRLVALLVEAHRVLDRPRLADQRSRRRQQLGDAASRRPAAQADEGAVGFAGALGVGRLPARLPPGGLAEGAVAADQGAERQLQLPPPDDVGGVAEGADHGQAGALVRRRQRVGEDGHGRAVERRRRHGAEERAVARVVGVGHQGDAGPQQLGAGGLDLQPAPLAGEAEPVVGAGHHPVLDLRLRHRRPVVDVPQGRRLLLVDQVAGQQAQEGALRGPLRPLADGGVGQRPVDRQAEEPPQLLEGPLVDRGQPVAQLDEVAPRHRRDAATVVPPAPRRRLEPRPVGLAGIAAHPEVVLHPALGGQAVVVPAHRVEDLPAPHAPVAGQDIGVGVGEEVADVERARDRRRRGVDGEDLRAGPAPVEAVGAVGLPTLAPAALQPVEGGGFGDLRSHALGSRGWHPSRAGPPGRPPTRRDRLSPPLRS